MFYPYYAVVYNIVKFTFLSNIQRHWKIVRAKWKTLDYDNLYNTYICMTGDRIQNTPFSPEILLLEMNISQVKLNKYFLLFFKTLTDSVF